MNKEFIVVDLRDGKTIGEMTMKDFSEWIEDTTQYMLWVYSNDYEDKSDYAKKRMLRDLKICADYSSIRGVEVEWNSFRFIPI